MAWHTTWNDPPERKRGFFVDRGGMLSPAVKLVLLVTVAVYVVDVLTQGLLSHLGELSVRSLLGLQVWRLVTYMFLHSLGGIAHIGWNMFIFVMLGRVLERQIGSRTFLWLYLGAGVLGGLAEVVFNLVMHLTYGLVMTRQGAISFLDIPAVGASAGVAGVMVAFAVRNPRAIFLLFFFLPIEARWLALIYVLGETRYILLALQDWQWMDGVAHAAHFGGSVVGFVAMKWGWRLSALWKQGARRRPRRTIDRGREKEEVEVDRILKKVQEEGVDSLTLREKMFLQEMGDKYRDMS